MVTKPSGLWSFNKLDFNGEVLFHASAFNVKHESNSNRISDIF